MSPDKGLMTNSSKTVVSGSWYAVKIKVATVFGSEKREGGRSVPAQESVSVAPGNTALTLIPSDFNSCLNTFVKPNCANLEMQ